MKKKIIFTVTNDLAHDQRMQRICATLAPYYEITLVGRELPLSKPLNASIFEHFQTYRIKCFFNNGKLFYLEYNLKLLFFLFRKVFTKEVDAFGAVDLDTIIPCFLTSKIFKKKIVYDAHEYFTETPEVERRPIIKRIWETIAQWIIPQIPFCYTVGDALAEIFSKRYNIHFQVIKNVPFSNVLKIEPPQEGKIVNIIYQGALNEGRGLEAAIEAMQQIEAAQLWLVGEGDLSEVLRGYVKAQGLEKKVIFWGWVEPEKLKYLTAQAHIGLNLLEARSLSYYYSLANKFFDYMQVGLPQISMNFPEYQKICNIYEVGILIQKADNQEIRTALNKIINDKKKYIKIQNLCLAAAKIYCWENEQTKILTFYEKVFS